MEDSEPAQSADTIMGDTDPALGDKNVTIDVKGFYFDHPEDSHQEPTADNAEKKVSTNDATALTLLPTAMKIDEEQNF